MTLEAIIFGLSLVALGVSPLSLVALGVSLYALGKANGALRETQDLLDRIDADLSRLRLEGEKKT